MRTEKPKRIGEGKELKESIEKRKKWKEGREVRDVQNEGNGRSKG